MTSKLREVDRQTASGGEQAPHREPDGDQSAAVAGIGDAGERKAENGVEERETESAQQADLGIADLQVAPDRADEQVEDLPVNEGEDIDEREHPKDVIGIDGARVCSIGRCGQAPFVVGYQGHGLDEIRCRGQGSCRPSRLESATRHEPIRAELTVPPCACLGLERTGLWAPANCRLPSTWVIGGGDHDAGGRRAGFIQILDE